MRKELIHEATNVILWFQYGPAFRNVSICLCFFVVAIYKTVTIFVSFRWVPMDVIFATCLEFTYVVVKGGAFVFSQTVYRCSVIFKVRGVPERFKNQKNSIWKGVVLCSVTKRRAKPFLLIFGWSRGAPNSFRL